MNTMNDMSLYLLALGAGLGMLRAGFLLAYAEIFPQALNVEVGDDDPSIGAALAGAFRTIVELSLRFIWFRSL